MMIVNKTFLSNQKSVTSHCVYKALMVLKMLPNLDLTKAHYHVLLNPERDHVVARAINQAFGKTAYPRSYVERELSIINDNVYHRLSLNPLLIEYDRLAIIRLNDTLEMLPNVATLTGLKDNCTNYMVWVDGDLTSLYTLLLDIANTAMNERSDTTLLCVVECEELTRIAKALVEKHLIV